VAELRLALVGPSWPFRGGIARTTTELAAALAERGTLAAFLTPQRQYPRWLYPGGGDLDPAACPRLAVAQRCYSVLEPWTWGRLLRRLRAASPRVLVLPYWTWAWAPLFRLVQWRGNLPTLAVVHNVADHDASAAQRRAARAVLRRCCGFLCHAGEVAETLRRQFPGRALTVHPLPAFAGPPADREAARRQLGVPEGTTAVLSFGLIRPYKGVEVLLEAARLLPADSPVVLLLAGEPWGGVGAVVQERLRDPALAGRVRAHLGWVAEDEVAWWAAAADVAVLPYRRATGSAVAALMLGYGLPLVASRVGGLAEVVEDGRNGLLVPPGEPAALAAALQRVVDPVVRARLAEGAQASAGRYSWASYATALEEVARGALTGRAGPGEATTPLGR
jgi:glycosyltransferase involved in cell wall biosynthesis